MSAADAGMPAWAGQEGYDVRFQWGPAAAPALAGGICVVVDVLRFTTAVEAAAARGVTVYPYRGRDATAAAFADRVGAALAGHRDPAGPSLSPLSMAALVPGTSLVLPSPNGSTCAILASEAGARVVAGCLRNAAAVGAWAGSAGSSGSAGSGGGPVTVIACGEKWPDGSLRPSLEDLLGAGAILAHVAGRPSPEARAAIAAFRDAEHDLPDVLRQCASGRELSEKGRDADIGYAAQLNVSTAVPVLESGAFLTPPGARGGPPSPAR
ncbi:MAG: 2-phosphosulfolactate phosphatase [Trebonia sp.]